MQQGKKNTDDKSLRIIKIVFYGIIGLAVFAKLFTYQSDTSVTHTPTFQEKQQERIHKQNSEWVHSVCQDLGCK